MAEQQTSITRPEALIFDYGRVLVGPVDVAAFNHSLDQLALEQGLTDGHALWSHLYISDSWEQAKRGLISHEEFWLDRLTSLGLVEETAQYQFKQRLYEHWGLYTEMRDLLYQLRSNYRLAILSNSSRRNFTEYISVRRGLFGLFEVILSSAEEGVAKPSPEFYHTVLRRLAIQPEQALFIDDLRRNTDAAEALRIPSIQFTGPASLREELSRCGII
nr:HAD family phosphatase [Anaerolineae bacterium]